jgi:hypothetical protein
MPARLVSALLACGAAAANQYTLDIRADRNLGVRGKTALTWRNETGRPAAEIPLVCTGRMKRASIGGKPVQIDDGRVLLPEPVATGGLASVEIEFEESARRSNGYRMLTGAWHPKAVTFRNGRYNPDQRQADNYDVTVTAPAALIVAAAGASIEDAPARDGQKRWRWRLENATSFGLAASPDFEETRRSSAGVDIRLYRLRGDTRFDPVMADYAIDAMAFYRQLFGFYPHPALVMLPATGITVYHKNTEGDYQRWIVAHEIAHQYWGFDTVIDDGDYYHWPGLALGIYSDQRYIATHGKLRYPSGGYRNAVAKGLDTTIRRTRDQRKALRYDWNNAVCHQKAYAVIRMLEDLMGADRFFELVRGLLDRRRFQYLSPDDFVKAAEGAAGRKLDWFFHDWVDTNAAGGFAIDAVEKGERGVRVRIRRTGAARFPVEIRLTMDDGVQAVKRASYEPEVETLEFPVAGQPKLVEIDPRGVCPFPRQPWESR